MTDSVVWVEGLSKKFTRSLRRSLMYAVADIGGQLFARARDSSKLRLGEFWALTDISFELRRGSGLGLIGPNGSGKTTLLRLLSGLIKPDRGQVRIRGRTAPLIALGAGFNPVLTGKENIYINMAMLGLSHRQIKQRIDDVLDFAEIGEAVNAPLQTFSSGMAARLGFACAIHTAPDILLVDEVLSVGDMRFRAKCYRKLSELRAQGTSFILVTHSLNAVLSMTEHAIYLRNGQQVMAGQPAEVVSVYENDMTSIDFGKADAGRTEPTASSESPIRIDRISLRAPDGRRVDQLQSGEAGSLVLEYVSHRDISEVVVQVLVRELSDEMRLVLNLNSARDAQRLSVRKGNGRMLLSFPHVTLGPGLYSVKVAVGESELNMSDAIEAFRVLVKAGPKMAQCALFQPRSWKVMDDQGVLL